MKKYGSNVHTNGAYYTHALPQIFYGLRQAPRDHTPGLVEPLPNPQAGGGRPSQGPRPEHRGVFVFGNDFNTCCDATLICFARVCVERCGWGERGGGVEKC